MSRFSGIAVSLFIFCIASISRVSAADSEALQLQPREEFTLSLPKIAASIDNVTGVFNGVRVSFLNSDDQVFIGTQNDFYQKNSPRGSEKSLYTETMEKAGYISKFEAKAISRVNKEFVLALEQFDALLQKGSWGKLLYLDCFFPRFLNGYFYLLCAARSSESALPRSARVPEECFDVSLNSPKTDARINRWRSSPENVIKLRIASKELSEQIAHWQKKIDRMKPHEDVATPRELEESIIILGRIYFNLQPPSPVMFKKSRY